MFHYRRAFGAIRTPFVGAAVGYQGPGDIATAANWKSWHGLRAFRASTTPGTAAIQVRYANTDSVTYSTLANGSVDFSTLASDIATRGSGANPLVEQWFDQTGNGDHQQAAGTFRPTLKPSAIGGFPSVLFSGAQVLNGPIAFTLSQPTSFSLVAKNTGTTNSMMMCSETQSVQAAYFPAGPDIFYAFGGGASSESVPAPANVFHAGQFIIQGGAGNGHLHLDGVDSPGTSDVGTGTFTGLVLHVGGQGGGTTFFTGELVEGGLYNGSLFSVRSAMNTNQHTYFGF